MYLRKLQVTLSGSFLPLKTSFPDDGGRGVPLHRQATQWGPIQSYAVKMENTDDGINLPFVVSPLPPKAKDCMDKVTRELILLASRLMKSTCFSSRNHTLLEMTRVFSSTTYVQQASLRIIMTMRSLRPHSRIIMP